jgi:hypothetical protein
MWLKYRNACVALLTFVVGVVIAYGWQSHSRFEDYLVETFSPKLEGSQFVPQMRACGPEIREIRGSSSVLSTGESLEQTAEIYQSADDAIRVLERRLEGASQIIERRKMLDGERAIAVFSSRASIFKRKGAVLSSISAPTVEIALEFEVSNADYSNVEIVKR